MNRAFGVPASADLGRLKAGHRTVLTTQTGPNARQKSEWAFLDSS
jgi:hypothetical protein